MELKYSAPSFPPELERQIFEICALSRPVVIPRLMLVAWRVKEWVEPLLYRTIALDLPSPIAGFPVFTSQNLLAVMQRKPESFFQHAVSDLLLLGHPRTDILSVCTGVKNLSIDYLTMDDESIPLLATFPLTHLYIEVVPLLHALTPTSPLFSQMTHLELFDGEDDPIISTGLPLLPRLTHVSFANRGFLRSCLDLLETSNSLSVLVCLDNEEMLSGEAESLSTDLRFVAMSLIYYGKDWQMGAHSGEDYWSRAERFIAQRRSGEIDAIEYRIIEPEHFHSP
ncbi:hypothetical protein DFH09DRAFT_603637 [Mycena vulgaris]|nr:hypothetical protein DFH09DRAFT_603637 [Mycena vulgaris]